ncbi:MAG: hypothetical protein K6G55_02270 [Selenomonadaceae bacterium]|nr:hypothetical protein [Selenomonadaceae bacterium]
MEEMILSPLLSNMLQFLSLTLSLILLFAVAYLWSSNSVKTKQLTRIQSDLQRAQRTLNTLEEKVSQIRKPKVVSEPLHIDAFGLDNADENKFGSEVETPLEPQKPWLNFVEGYNQLAALADERGFSSKCEKFIRENKLKLLAYNREKNFYKALYPKDSFYWAFKCSGEEYAFVPNPMHPCDEIFYDEGGLKEIYEANYEVGTYIKYKVKKPAILTNDSEKGWITEEIGEVNLEQK